VLSTVTTSLGDIGSGVTYEPALDGASDTLQLAVTLQNAIEHVTAINADFATAKTNPISPTTLGNYFGFKIRNFESVKLAVYNSGELLGLIDNIVIGTANHDNGAPGNPPALTGTDGNDLIVGLGGTDVIHGGKGNDIIAGGGVSTNSGGDTLYGDDGDDVFVYLPTDNGYYDSIDGGDGDDTAIAFGNAVIGLANFSGTVETFVGTGDTIVQGSPSIHNTLNFTNTALDGIKEVDGGGPTSNDIFYISTKSDATYRGGGGIDTFHLQGGKAATFLYSGTANGFDSFVDHGYDGTAIAQAQDTDAAPVTVIGLVGYNNQLDAIQGTGDTIIRASDSVHDNLNFATTTLTGIASIESGGGNDTVTTSIQNRGAAITYDGGSGTGDTLLLAITLDEAIARKADILADLQAAKAGGAGTTVLSKFFKFTVSGFESFQLTLALGDQTVGRFEDIILGTANHDTTTPGYAPAIQGTSKNELLIGLGGNDVIRGGAGNDVIVGGGVSTNSGNDALYGEGGDDVFVYLPTDNGFYDVIDGGAGNDKVIAVAGAVIGLGGYADTVETFVGTGDTVVQGSPSIHNTLDFRNTALVGIKEVDGGGATSDDTFYVSTKSDAFYRGGGGNDTFHLQGSQAVTFLYTGTGNGFDSFVNHSYAGTAIARAESSGTVIGIGDYANQLKEFQGTGDTIIQASDGVHNVLNFSDTKLTGIAVVDSGGGDDTITVSKISAASYRGGSGNDRFIIPDGCFPDVVILDFTKGADKIGLAAGYSTIVVEGADTVITLPNGRKIRLKDYTSPALAASDFVVAS